MDQEEKNVIGWLRSIFSIPQYQNVPLAAPSVLIISIALIAVSFIAYLFGPSEYDEELRNSFLLVFTLAVLLAGIHFLSPKTARWLVGLITTLIVFWLAWQWQSVTLLNLLVIPVILAVIANLPVILLTAVVQSAVLLSPAWINIVGIPEVYILLAVIWLVTLTTAGAHVLVTGVLARASRDYDRLQNLLSESRDQQLKLSQALEELEHANRQLSLLYDKNISLRRVAEEATEAKSTYIAKVSHEIRTPLNMILGITESIIENREDYGDDLPLDLEDDIRIIRRNSEHLLSLVNDVLDLTRAESSKMNLRKEWVDIGSEIDHSIEIVMPLAKKKNLSLSAQYDHHLPQIYCDRTRIRQVILNLLSNAVRYTPSGEIRVTAHSDETWLRVQVRDTGPGISPGDVERIFEPFYRGSSSANQETTGTGLGLSVSRQIVELHSGKIEVESQAGIGSTFSFYLPVMRDLGLSRPPNRFISEQWAWVERKERTSYNFLTPQKKRVFVCSPEGTLITTLENQLAEKAEFTNIQSIDDLLKEINTTPAHLVIVNEPDPVVLMSFMLKASEIITDTPIIGCSFTFANEKITRAGALGYLQKPFSNQHLREAVARVEPYPKRILIVDDNTEVQRLIARVLQLQEETTEFLLAETGAHAFNLIQRKKPDLILLDLTLPDTDGWQVLREIKNHPDWCAIPVIIESAGDLDDSPPYSKIVMFSDGKGMTTDQFAALLTANLNLQ